VFCISCVLKAFPGLTRVFLPLILYSDFVRTPDILEDVTELKYSFRRLGIKCSLCLGERGGMNQCRHNGCQNWIHVTCARSVGTCEVIHGEDALGPVAENPWSLMCPEHSKIKPQDVPKGALSVESLIETAKEFPPEPPPPLLPIKPKPFNTATGEERTRLLMNKAYESELLLELTEKNLHGVRCEVCDQEADSKLRCRCCVCNLVFCLDCSLPEIDKLEGNFRCPGCTLREQNKNDKGFKEPQCLACYQKGGLLRSAWAKPSSKRGQGHGGKAKSSTNPLLGKQLWVHSLCTFWHPRLVLDRETGLVDCSNAV